MKELSVKFECSGRNVYNDFETRDFWQPSLQAFVEPEKILFKIINRYEQIYRQASVRLLTSSNELAQISALNTMAKVNAALFEAAVLPELLSRLKSLEDKAAKGVFVP